MAGDSVGRHEERHANKRQQENDALSPPKHRRSLFSLLMPMSAWESKCVGAQSRAPCSGRSKFDQGAYWLGVLRRPSAPSQRQSAVRLRDSAAATRGRFGLRSCPALGADRCTVRRQYDRTRAARCRSAKARPFPRRLPRAARSYRRWRRAVIQSTRSARLSLAGEDGGKRRG